MTHRDVDEYIEGGAFMRSCFDSGCVDSFGDCKFCGVPAGTGGCHMCVEIAARGWELEDYADGL